MDRHGLLPVAGCAAADRACDAPAAGRADLGGGDDRARRIHRDTVVLLQRRSRHGQAVVADCDGVVAEPRSRCAPRSWSLGAVNPPATQHEPLMVLFP